MADENFSENAGNPTPIKRPKNTYREKRSAIPFGLCVIGIMVGIDTGLIVLGLLAYVISDLS